MNDPMNDNAAHPLKLFNSLTRQMEEFVPVHPGEARVYTCGPTVYNYQHIGNMRAYVFADLLGRTLSWKGYKLTHIINITDVGHLTSDADVGDDKMEKAAAQSGKSAWDIAKYYTDAYWKDIERLNIRQPAKWAIATDHVEEMIAFAKSIADKHCYELDSGLYFDVSTVPDYGRLAGAQSDDIEGRIDAVEGKRHPQDFAIWRKTPAGETRQMEWDSPWGKGAPGWHLECSQMSNKYLGEKFDIHTGGIDHREIHHPNEIAQNQAHNCSEHSGANIWMHNNFLIDRAGKMSKSSGDFLRLQVLIDRGIHPLAYRLMCLQAHYRSELEFTWENLEAASLRLKRLVMAVRRISPDTKIMSELRENTTENGQLSNQMISQIRSIAGFEMSSLIGKFDEAISDDLNTPIALTVLDQAIKDRNLSKRDRVRLVALFDSVLGLDLLRITRRKLRVSKTVDGLENFSISDADVEAVVRTRRLLKSRGDYTLADELKALLSLWGVELMDGDKLQWDWRIEI